VTCVPSLRAIRAWRPALLGTWAAVLMCPVTASWAAYPGPGANAFDMAYSAAARDALRGSNPVDLAGQAMFTIPAGTMFVPMPAARGLLSTMGNASGPDLVGVLLPQVRSEWMTVITFEKSGFVREVPAAKWDAGDLRASLQASNDEDNRVSRQQGLQQYELGPWLEDPAYDAARHRLTWSVAVSGLGDPVAETANYNAWLLGHDGILAFNLVSSPQRVEQRKPVLTELLATLTFNHGKGYEDFVESRDRVADFDITGIISRQPAKKPSSPIVGALIKWIAVIVAGVALVAGLSRFFKRVPPPDRGRIMD
jgi:uncharacterized membrane-anchored protein